MKLDHNIVACQEGGVSIKTRWSQDGHEHTGSLDFYIENVTYINMQAITSHLSATQMPVYSTGKWAHINIKLLQKIFLSFSPVFF